jgi:hypothetical protein
MRRAAPEVDSAHLAASLMNLMPRMPTVYTPPQRAEIGYFFSAPGFPNNSSADSVNAATPVRIVGS